MATRLENQNQVCWIMHPGWISFNWLGKKIKYLSIFLTKTSLINNGSENWLNCNSTFGNCKNSLFIIEVDNVVSPHKTILQTDLHLNIYYLIFGLGKYFVKERNAIHKIIYFITHLRNGYHTKCGSWYLI